MAGAEDLLRDVYVWLSDPPCARSQQHRCWFDPPEVEPVAIFPADGARHWCYFRDAPDDAPEFVVETRASRGAAFVLLSDTLFGTCLGALAAAPASREASKARSVLSAHAERAGVPAGSAVNCKARSKRAVAATSSHLGVWVPMTGEVRVCVGPRAARLGTVVTCRLATGPCRWR